MPSGSQTIWIDAQLSPALAPWIAERFGVEAFSAARLGFRDAADAAIFEAARKGDAVVMTKDADFVRLLEQHGPPPRVVWITVGNTSNVNLKNVLEGTLSRALAMLAGGEPLVEIAGL